MTTQEYKTRRKAYWHKMRPVYIRRALKEFGEVMKMLLEILVLIVCAFIYSGFIHG